MPYVNVDVDLDDIDTDDLIRELILRGYDYNTRGVDADEARALLQSIYQNRRCGNADYHDKLDQLCWMILGRM
jgi:hypothetical protein